MNWTRAARARARLMKTMQQRAVVVGCETSVFIDHEEDIRRGPYILVSEPTNGELGYIRLDSKRAEVGYLVFEWHDEAWFDLIEYIAYGTCSVFPGVPHINDKF